MRPDEAPPKIGTLNEKPLHAALKAWYAEPDDRFEVSIEGFVIDIVRGDLLIEVQTRNFASLKPKLIRLTAQHPVRLVYPVAKEKWIVKLSKDDQTQSTRRKSPKRGTFEQVFDELIRLPKLVPIPNFGIEVLLIQEEEVRRHDRSRGWRRRGWVTHERRLLGVLDRRLFESPADFRALIPPTLAQPFTASDLAAAIAKPRRLAGKMAYCLREMGAISVAGKRGRAYLYSTVPHPEVMV